MFRPAALASLAPLLVLALALALVPALRGAAAREVSGTLTYPERIALPETAVVALELRDRGGLLLAEAGFATEGRQVPLPFAIEAPEEVELVLRAAVFADGRALRTTAAVPVPAGAGPVTLPPLRLEPHVAMGFASRLVCGGVEVELGFIGGIARLRLGERVIDLAPEPAASGARFAAEDDPDTWIWSRGDRALVTLAGETLPECLPAAALPELPFAAVGHEPPWALRLEEGKIRLILDLGAAELSAPLPEPEAVPGGILYAPPGAGFSALLAAGLCRDIATGMPHPFAVTVRHEGADLTGCGGDPGALLRGPEWRIETVAGKAAPERLRLAFGAGEVSAVGPCNYLFGPLVLTGEGLTLGPIAATRRMCLPDVMQAEAALMAALGAVQRFDFTSDGALALIGPSGTVLTARR